MKRIKIQSYNALKAEMLAVARGQKPAPKDAGQPSFNSVAALMQLLTRENRALLAVIRDLEPESIAELSAATGRAAPNLARTLAKLEAAGFVRFETTARRKRPIATVRKLRVEIDPFSPRDRLVLTRKRGPRAA